MSEYLFIYAVLAIFDVCRTKAAQKTVLAAACKAANQSWQSMGSLKEGMKLKRYQWPRKEGRSLRCHAAWWSGKLARHE